MYQTIKEMADKQGLSIRQLEIKAGLSNGSIDKWKKCSPTLANAGKVANALGVSVTTLIKKSKK